MERVNEHAVVLHVVMGFDLKVPSTLVKPVIVATAATTNVIEGVKNQVAPEDYQDLQDKWKGESDK